VSSSYTTLHSYEKNNQIINGTFIIGNDSFLNCNVIPGTRTINSTFVSEDGIDDRVYGCTSPEADNYNPLANVDDGTCIIFGCTDPSGINFKSSANYDDGSCIYRECQDPRATNYNPFALNNDGCIYPLPYFTLQPADYGVPYLTNYVLNTELESTTPVIYSWLKNNIPISNTNFKDFPFTNFIPASAGLYTLVVTNSGGTIKSRDASIYVFYQTPVFTLQPVSSSIKVGSNYTFNPTVTSNTPLTYQWYFNSIAIPSASSNNYTITNYNSGTDTGAYILRADNLGGTTFSSPALIYTDVPPPPPPPPPPPVRCTDVQADNYNQIGDCVYSLPSFTQQPTGNTLITTDDIGTTYDITSQVYSKSPVKYQWKKNGINIGTNSNNYSTFIGYDPKSILGVYKLVATNKGGSVTSNNLVVDGKQGCTNSSATNYDSKAIISTNTCTFPPPTQYKIDISSYFSYSLDVTNTDAEKYPIACCYTYGPNGRDCYFYEYCCKVVTDSKIVYTETQEGAATVTGPSDCFDVGVSSDFNVDVSMNIRVDRRDPICADNWDDAWQPDSNQQEYNYDFSFTLHFTKTENETIVYNSCTGCDASSTQVGSINFNNSTSTIDVYYQGSFDQAAPEGMLNAYLNLSLSPC
jgi:hypothetical protein